MYPVRARARGYHSCDYTPLRTQRRPGRVVGRCMPLPIPRRQGRQRGRVVRRSMRPLPVPRRHACRRSGRRNIVRHRGSSSVWNRRGRGCSSRGRSRWIASLVLLTLAHAGNNLLHPVRVGSLVHQQPERRSFGRNGVNAQYCQVHKMRKGGKDAAQAGHRQVRMGVPVLRTALSQRRRCIMRRPCIRFCTSSTLRCMLPISDSVKLLQCTSTVM